MAHGKQRGVCKRLAELRFQHFGTRGKSRFARELGIGSSTYDRYERDRMPPADLLLKAARVTGVRLEWLITGDGPRQAESDNDQAAVFSQRLRALLRQKDDLAGRIDEFLSKLEEDIGEDQ